VAKYFSGKDGKLFVGTSTTAVGQLQSWSFSQSMSVLEITAMGDTDSSESDQVTLKLRLEETADSDTDARDIIFKAYITSVSMSSSVGEISSVDFNWEADGAPTTDNLST